MSQPESIDALLAQANRAAQQKQLDQAADLLDQILAREPEHVTAIDLLGFVRFFQQRFAEAEQCCRRALSIKPDHPYALKGLGLCLASQNQLDEGVIFLERAISQSPRWFDPYWDLTVVLLQGQRYAQALQVLTRGASAIPERRSEFASFAAKIQRQMPPGPSEG